VVRLSGEEQSLVGFVDQLWDPPCGEPPVGEGEWQLLTPDRDDLGIAGVGGVDRGDGRREALAQTAHSESPTSAENGPVSS
jgi:hypothetical protein